MYVSLREVVDQEDEHEGLKPEFDEEQRWERWKKIEALFDKLKEITGQDDEDGSEATGQVSESQPQISAAHIKLPMARAQTTMALQFRGRKSLNSISAMIGSCLCRS